MRFGFFYNFRPLFQARHPKASCFGIAGLFFASAGIASACPFLEGEGQDGLIFFGDAMTEIDSKMGGFIWLHESIQESPFYKSHNAIFLFYHLALKANWKDNQVIWNKKPMTIKKGQLITGIHSLAEQTKLTVKQIRNSLDVLENCQVIRRERASKYSVITMLKYVHYGHLPSYKGQAKGQAEGKQRATKEDLKDLKTLGTTNVVPMPAQFHPNGNGNGSNPTKQVVAYWRDQIEKDKDPETWNKVYYKQHISHAHRLLLLTHQDIDETKNAIRYIHDYLTEKGLSCALSTCVKRFDIWRNKNGSKEHIQRRGGTSHQSGGIEREKGKYEGVGETIEI